MSSARPSWQARCLNLCVRALVRRRDWGNERALTRRARRVFGTPAPFAWLASRGVKRVNIRSGNVRGEWLVPPDAKPGVLLYIHGGGYVACSPSTHRPIASALARMTGRRVFSVDYRLAPEHRFPAALDDVIEVYRRLLETEEWGTSIAVAGDSAGGGLALSLLVAARDAGLPAPVCAVCFSPWTDLASAGASSRENDGRCAMFHMENGPDFAAAYLGDASPTDPRASPLYADLSGLPPVLLQVSSTELLLDDARRLHERIQLVYGLSEITIYEDVFHVWQMLNGMVPEAKRALQEAANFVMTAMDTA